MFTVITDSVCKSKQSLPPKQVPDAIKHHKKLTASILQLPQSISLGQYSYKKLR